MRNYGMSKHPWKSYEVFCWDWQFPEIDFCCVWNLNILEKDSRVEASKIDTKRIQYWTFLEILLTNLTRFWQKNVWKFATCWELRCWFQKQPSLVFNVPLWFSINSENLNFIWNNTIIWIQLTLKNNFETFKQIST